MDFNGLEFLVVGAGLSGLTVARKLADRGRKVAVVEKRKEFGGLCSTYLDAPTGIEVHKFGSHILHSSNHRVIQFLSQFCSLSHYRHRVFSMHEGKVYPLPVNLDTISRFYNMNFTPSRARHLLNLATRNETDLSNFGGAVRARMGASLYQAFIEGYTRKHWGVEPDTLPARYAERVPVRTTYDGDYFTDFWQGLPVNGYQWMFLRMAIGLQCSLGVDFTEVRHLCPPNCRVVYTGALDAYFDFKFGRLPWRSVELAIETHDVGDYQGAAVINFPDEDAPHTRIHEFKHLRPERKQSADKTIIAAEFVNSVGEPAYPVDPDGEMARAYRQASTLTPNVHFLGRLARYQYLDMDDAVDQALALAEKL